MHINEVLKFCEDNGKKITRQALYQAGLTYGFITKQKGKRSLDFDKEKFLEWFNKGLEEIPEGYVRVSELMKKYGLSLVFAYNLLKDPECVHQKFGRGDGVTYVKLDGIEDIIKKNRTKKNNERNQ